MNPPLRRILVWLICVLVGWMGARFLSPAPVTTSKVGPSTTGTTNHSPEATESALSSGRTRDVPVSAAPKVAQPGPLANGPLPFKVRAQRSDLLGLVSNAAPVNANLAEARSLALEILSMPELQQQSSSSNSQPFSPNRTWDPTLRRQIEIGPSGNVIAKSLFPAGNPEDELRLEHPRDVAAIELLSEFGATNATLAIRYANREVFVWNVELAAILARFTNVPPSQRIRLSADGSTAALIRTSTGTVEWRRFKRGQESFGVLPVTNAIGAIPSPDGTTIATWTSPNSPIQLLQISDGALMGSLPFVHLHNQLQWSSDGVWIGLSGPGGFTSVWKASSLQLVSTFRLQDPKGSDWKFVPGRPDVVALGSAGTLTWYNPWTRIPELPIAADAHAFGFSPEGASLVLFRQRGQIADRYRIEWNPHRIASFQDPPVTAASPHSLAWNSTGSILTVATTSGLGIYQVDSGYIARIATNLPILGVQSLREGTELWMTTKRGVASLRLEKNDPTRVDSTSHPVHEFTSEPLGVSAALDGKSYAVRYTKHIAIYSEGTRPLEVRTAVTAEDIEMTSDGKWLAVTKSSGGLHVLSTRTGQTVWNSPEKSRCVVRYSPDGKILAVGSGQEYSLWSVDGFSPLWKMPRDTSRGSPAAMDFSSDGKWFACVGGIDDLKFVRVSDGRELFRLTMASAGSATEVRFSPNQLRLCVLHSGEIAQIWDLDWIQANLARIGLGLDKE